LSSSLIEARTDIEGKLNVFKPSKERVGTCKGNNQAICNISPNVVET